MGKKFSVYAINVTDPIKYEILNSKDFEENYKKEFNENCTLKKFFNISNRKVLFENKYDLYYSFFSEKELRELIQLLSNELLKNNSLLEENLCIFKIDFFDITKINENFKVLNSEDNNNHNNRKRIFDKKDKVLFFTHKELSDYLIKLNNILKKD